MNKMKKILVGLMLLFSFVGKANDGGKDIIKIHKAYMKTLRKYKKTKEKTTKQETSDEIKEKYQISSGDKIAGEKISAKYNYYKTNTYDVYTRVKYTTTLKLNPDEEVVYIGGGDTENWKIDDTKGGVDGSSLIFIKPSEADLTTNLAIITNKRTYFVMIHSSESGTYNPLVEWKYPYEDLMKFKTKISDNDKDISLLVKDAKQLEFGYKYDKTYRFSPDSIYNDGEKTVIILPNDLQEMPVVYGYGEDGELSLVNTRIIENKIVIDKVLTKMQLVLGKNVINIYKK
ncbi:TrbG/VirB9 family P-type conjugative transfer protein [Sneathia sanguinegens]|jgi:P-type conjugative transfer protein TrbG|uniref:TrbG/VirB9 family P-type conjugative transfer protein n=1 Tax=Sneathia sanguinegens TaxID=40543 RepID=UPI00258816C2|nr:TrbG/VirB9 family P-type conjugative transfer protein [Sneathia sanguinegens]MDU4652155.1 TrbG/VirB9 family P-type conjugative transfer protein [Sneathia sanguinegens]